MRSLPPRLPHLLLLTLWSLTSAACAHAPIASAPSSTTAAAAAPSSVASAAPAVAPTRAARPADPCTAAPAPNCAPAHDLPVLRVGTSGDYAPFSRAGQGFDIELAERMAGDLGYRIEWVPFVWPELKQRVQDDAFDVGMAGITWKPDRSVVGWMSRAIAAGAPCVLSRADGVTDGDAGHAPVSKVAVNRGGILERWARARYAAGRIVTVDDNLSLPDLLARGEVGAIVTDRFEVEHFARPGWARSCEPPRDRKVYWVAPGRAADLAPQIDAWLAAHEAEVKQLRGKWLGQASDWTALDHLVDLLARRLALMPAVAAYKHAHGLPIEDRGREAVVLDQVLDAADRAGLERESARALFVEQIELAKAIQRRTGGEADAMDLDGVLRPALSRLGARIMQALAACAAQLPRLKPEQLDLLVPLLEPDERARLLEALRAVRLSRAP